MSSESEVCVAIIGGGVAGLTLANILEQSSISYILWESQDQIAPPAGASIGLMPNGLRILDQIGVIDDVEEYKIPHDRWEHRDADGTLYHTVDAMRHFDEVLGYNGIFMERQRLLEILHNNIRDKSRIHTNKRVTSVENFPSHALVTATDGTQIRSAFVAGADGVHSAVRRSIQALTPTAQPPADYLTAKYSCVYGISTPHPSLPPGRNYTIYRRTSSLLLFTAAGGILYWFIFQALPSPLPYGRAPRYTAADVASAAAAVADAVIKTGDETVVFADVFARKKTALMTALEEGVAAPHAWTTGRTALVGDAAHKMVPHAAMGANQAMESAACFANGVRAVVARGDDAAPRDWEAVEACLEAYKERREARVRGVVEAAAKACRVQLLVGEEAREWVEALPRMGYGEWLERTMEVFSRAEKVEGWEGGGERVRFYDEQARKWIEQRAGGV
ncbi:hypothetical protein SLS54_007570 [Diplodia seriata]